MFVILQDKKPTHQLMGQEKRRVTKIRRPKAGQSGTSINDKCRPEVAGDVISGMVVEYANLNDCAQFGGSRLNSIQIIRIFDRPDPFYALLCSILFAFCSRSEAASDVISGRFVTPVHKCV